MMSLRLGGLTWKQVGKTLWAETSKDDVFGQAAQLSYYFLLALFPALLFMVSLLGYIAGENSELRANLFTYLSAMLPGDASQLVSKTVSDVTPKSGGGKISFGILAMLWAASNGMGAICKSLNIAYGVKETRRWWKVRLVAIGLTLALSVLVLAALALLLGGNHIADFVAAKVGLGHSVALTWKIVQWPVLLAFVLFAFLLVYYFAPDVHDQRWEWITPGAVVGIVIWLAGSFGFKIYLHYFNNYSSTYGSLGAVIILILWFYFSGVAILLGGEINATIEDAKAKQGAPGAKEKGEKHPQEQQAGARAALSRPSSHTQPASRNPARPVRIARRGPLGSIVTLTIIALVLAVPAWLDEHCDPARR